MEKRSRLGRGLSSLLNSTSVPPREEPLLAEGGRLQAPPSVPGDVVTPADPALGEIGDIADPFAFTPPPGNEMFHVELSKIVPNPNQPRRHFHEASLAALAESMKLAGIIQPMVVLPVGDQFELIAGERRWRAAKLAGLDKVPVIVRPVNSIEQAQLALIENIHREDLNPMDRAAAYRKLLDLTGLIHQELAAQLGEQRSTIANHLRLLDLPDSVRQLVGTGELSLGHAKLLCGVDKPDIAENLAKRTVLEGLSVRKLEQLIKAQETTPVPAAKSPVQYHIADLERQISRDLQMRTEVKQGKKGNKGRLVIHYASLDQFDELLARLSIKVED